MAVVYPTYSTNQSLEQSIAVRKIFFLFAKEVLSKSHGNVLFFFCAVSLILLSTKKKKKKNPPKKTIINSL